MDTQRSAPADDYRSSHLEKGAGYDAALEAGAFDAYMARLERNLLLQLVPRLFPRGIPRYLDFACGTGRIMEAISPLAEVSIGVDVSGTMLARAREKCPDAELMLQDATVDPLRIEPVDLVSAFRFLGNAQPALRQQALHALHDVLAPGGYLIINNHRNASSIHNLLLRLRRTTDGSDLTLRALDGLLSDAGFERVRVYGIGAWVVRHALRRPEALSSSWARRLEPLSRLPGMPRLSPDMVVVARRL